MAPDGANTLLLALAASGLAAIATAVVWDRLYGRVALVVRPLAVGLCLFGALTSAVVALDRELEVFDNWSELFGAAPAPVGGSPQLVIDTRTDPSHGQIVAFAVVGRASHLSLPAYAYLPPGYDTTLRRLRLPVVMALDGFPGTPQVWLKGLGAPQDLDREI